MDQEELKLSDRLAIQRTLRAEDRSLLAWMRTSLSLIGFGFTIYKFLEYFQKQGPTLFMRQQTPRNIGLFLILTGTVPLFFTMLQYGHARRKLLGKAGRAFLTPEFLAACIVLVLGIVLTASIVLSIAIL